MGFGLYLSLRYLLKNKKKENKEINADQMLYLNLEKKRFMLSPKEGRSSLITEFFRIDLCCLVKKFLGKNSLDLPMKMSIYISWMSCSGTRHHL